MIGLILVTHGRLADELRLALEHVVGAQRQVACVCIGPDDDIERRREEIRNRVLEVDSGDGVVLLTDMFGGTPSNLAISQMNRPGVEVIAGVNLPMLVKLAKVRSHRTLADAVDCALTAGRKYIACASAMVPHCRALEPGLLGPRLVESKLVESVPVESKPAESVPVESAPVESKMTGTGG